MHHIRYEVPAEHAGRSVLSVARGELKVSAGQFRRLKFHQGLWVDGRAVHSDCRLQAGQVLELRFADEGAPIPAGTAPLQVAWEDEDLLIADKPAPLPSVASRQGGETLENRVYVYLGQPADFVYRPVNRLDKGTSGLMLIAKNAHMQQRMQRLLHTDAFMREYLAVLEGVPPLPEGRVDLPIGHGRGIGRVIDPGGKAAITDYILEETAQGRSLVRLQLMTGRTHQIRVHMKALGCPVVGDFLYGTEVPQLPGRFALHAHRLRFIHPMSGEVIDLRSPLPQELAVLMAKL